jgi:anti-anti-sigma factor
MNASPCEAAVRRLDSMAIIDLKGDINRSAEGAVNAAYEEAAGSGASQVLLNFTQVGYINSTGIAVIVAVLARSRKEGRTLISCGLSEHYREIFEITRLSDFMTIFSDETTALREAPAPA